MLGAQLRVTPDDSWLDIATESMIGAVTDALTRQRHVVVALSGGTTPWDVYERVGQVDLDWSRLTFVQADERIAPQGNPARNNVYIRHFITERVPVDYRPFPVDPCDLDAAEKLVAGVLRRPPQPIDLVVLGLGSDGHTASLIPGDPALDVDDRLVAITEPYDGYRRMTLTQPVLAGARRRLVLVRGENKRVALEATLNQGHPRLDPILAGPGTMIIADDAAGEGLH